MLSAHWEGIGLNHEQGQTFYLKIPQQLAQEIEDSSRKSTPFHCMHVNVLHRWQDVATTENIYCNVHNPYL
jgi:hypothetical protein